MTFFSGFGFKNEYGLFSGWLNKNERFTVAGFSMGAIDAIEHCVSSLNRIDKLLLFSPAYFTGLTVEQKNAELYAFEKNKDIWLKLFYKKTGNKDASLQSLDNATSDNLKKLLFYEYCAESILSLKQKGIVVDVYLGLCDKIIDVNAASDFFKPLARQTIVLKNGAHVLAPVN